MSPQLKVVREKHYLPVDSEDDLVDSQFPSIDHAVSTTWRRRFYILLASSFFCLALLGGLFFSKMKTPSCFCRSSMPDPEVTVPYCEYYE